jgi:hypothetical protein
MSANITVNLGRAQVLRAVAAWLEGNPALPIKYLAVDETGEVRLTPAETGPTTSYRDREVHGLYRLAEETGAEVHLDPAPYGTGWELSARWKVGAVPMVAEHRIYQSAVNLRLAENQDEPQAEDRRRAAS